VARQGGVSEPAGAARRLGVFVDYWYAYTTARQLFAPPGAPPPSWFGNVSPRALAGSVVKRPPVGSRRSERQLAGLHVFVRHFDPQVHRSQLDRVRRWELEGAEVVVGPSAAEGGGHWQSSLSVALATAVVEALARGRYDTAVVMAGDGALWPMLAAVRGEETPSGAVELATWVAPDGTVPTGLTGLPGLWCHRLGEATFRVLLDDRRPAHHPQGAAVAKPKGRPGRAPAPPPTAMAAALAAAGVRPGAGPQTPAATSGPAAADVPDHPAVEMAADDADHGMRRLAQRLFGRGA